MLSLQYLYLTRLTSSSVHIEHISCFLPMPPKLPSFIYLIYLSIYLISVGDLDIQIIEQIQVACGIVGNFGFLDGIIRFLFCLSPRFKTFQGSCMLKIHFQGLNSLLVVFRMETWVEFIFNLAYKWREKWLQSFTYNSGFPPLPNLSLSMNLLLASS